MNKIDSALNSCVSELRGGFAVPYNKTNFTVRMLTMFLTVLMCVFTVYSYFSSFSVGEPQNYPLENSVTQYDPYIQQFDAFMKGQLHIDYTPSDQFLEIENPYDPSQRDNVYYLYDRAYFEGKYYSYFGTAPIFTVIFPYYLVTGQVPPAAFTQLIFMLIYAFFFPMLIFVLGEKLSKKITPFMLALVAYTAYISSLQLLFGRGRTPFYYIAATSAMAFLSVFAFLFFKGLFSEKCKTRCMYFLFAGLFFALSFHSRVNTAFAAVFFIVPAVIFGIVMRKRQPIEIAEDENLTFYKKYRVNDVLYELGSLASLVLVGFIFAFAFNQARFGNMLDFGSTYQLTIADVSTYKLDMKEFGLSTFYYFISPLREDLETGALNFGYTKISPMNRLLYVDAHFGILLIPYMLLSLGIPVIVGDRSKSRALRITALAAFVGVFVIVWIDFCLGGVIYRYMCDFSGMLSVLAAVVVFYITDKISEIRSVSLRAIIKTALVLFFVFSIYRTCRIMAITNGNVLEMKADSLFFKLFGTLTE